MRRPLPARGFVWALLTAVAAGAAAEPPHEVVLPSGVRYVDLQPGTGEEARPGKILAVRYVGRLEGGKTFDATPEGAEPLTLRLGAGDVIKGLDQGLAGMRVGGKRRLTIPPELGFGKEGAGECIPPNATLVYEVELVALR
ncbi:MAG TPA: peptidylprolyl isomerase [Acidobacteria bacterium]|nr:peptidylprolyl isomerase [Acidobacteriota bacterium]